MAAATTSHTELAVEYDVPVPMADGTVLFADVLRPAGSGRFPVILVRTPFFAPHLA